MKAVWLTTPLIMSFVADPRAGHRLLACPTASARLRMGVAANAWSADGNENLLVAPDADVRKQALHFADVQVCIVSKFTADLTVPPWVNTCRDAKNAGCRLVVDICDYPFRNASSITGDFYAQAIEMADAIVVNSARMAELMAPHARVPIAVIEDAILDAMSTPRFAPAGRLKLLWFGHPSNLRFLDPWLRVLVNSAPRPCGLVIVTLDGSGAREVVREINAQFAPGFEAQFVEWSLPSTRAELARCDIALLPVDPSDPGKGGASANRIAEVLNAGRFAVANPLRSYLPFSDCTWLGHDLLEGIDWALTHRDEALHRIRRGQTLVAGKYSMAMIGQQWLDLLRGLAYPGNTPR